MKRTVTFFSVALLLAIALSGCGGAGQADESTVAGEIEVCQGQSGLIALPDGRFVLVVPTIPLAQDDYDDLSYDVYVSKSGVFGKDAQKVFHADDFKEYWSVDGRAKILIGTKWFGKSVSVDPIGIEKPFKMAVVETNDVRKVNAKKVKTWYTNPGLGEW